MYFEFNVPPMAQSRPGITTANGYSRAYEKADIKKWKMNVATLASSQMAKQGTTMFSKNLPLELTCTFGIQIPASYSMKKKRALHNHLHTSKPDVDNFVKALLDALTGVVWEDDQNISVVLALKYYTSDDPKINVQVEVCKEEDLPCYDYFGINKKKELKTSPIDLKALLISKGWDKDPRNKDFMA